MTNIGKRFHHKNSTRVWTVTAESACGTVLEITSNGTRRRLPSVAFESPDLVFTASVAPTRVDSLPPSPARDWVDVESGTWSMTHRGVFAQ